MGPSNQISLQQCEQESSNKSLNESVFLGDGPLTLRRTFKVENKQIIFRVQ